LGEQCALNTDCAAPLVCRLAKCRNECRGDRDCPTPTACRLDSEGLGSCVPPDELRCDGRVCPPPLACVDGTCRNLCRDEAECPDEFTCREVVALEACFATDESTDAGVRDSGPPADGGIADAPPAPPDSGPADAGVADATADDAAVEPPPCRADAGLSCAPCAVVQLAAGGRHSCAVGADGLAYCWGANDDGQLGDGTSDPSPVPVLVRGLANVAEVQAGPAHTCARGNDGSVWCWGDGASGRLGNGSTAPSPTPVPVMDLPAATDLAVGGAHACAVTTDRRVFCWGSNTLGALGIDGGPSSVRTATAVLDIDDATQVAAGPNHACARRMTGAISCWGANRRGQLGDSTTETRRAPVTTLGVAGAVEVTAGGSTFNNSHSCARLDDGTVSCWGDNLSGQLGRDTSPDSRSPNAGVVAGIDGVVSISAGSLHTCAVSGTRLYCWGANAGGQLGTGSSGGSRTEPQRVGAPSTATQVAAGGIGAVSLAVHTCGAFGGSGARIACWGHNGDGQLGHGTSMTSEPSPVGVCGF